MHTTTPTNTNRRVRVTRPLWEQSMQRHYIDTYVRQPPVNTRRMTEEERVQFLADVQTIKDRRRIAQGSLYTRLA